MSGGGVEYGVFEDGECFYDRLYGEAGRRIGEGIAREMRDDPEGEGHTYEVTVICQSHPNRPRHSCPECAA
ncbi:hypothetical protein KME66_14750 [Streptomyces sp. YPW6]|uniref:hypothetical protein n=1 Tax=Streptomyces sp. YPW6 TaxID=2840373 RepID=UPI001C0D203F|nr:hypothetical protein [Streptomyces sp. YPW6]QWQ42129.1 hypothetical protein KME66_14750 [Streptomyces sp. YPW6]